MSINKRHLHIIELVVAIVLILLLTVLVLSVGAERIVAFIGVENTYLVTFFVALFGGMNSIGGPSYIATVLTFVSGGSIVWLIALAASVGTSIGDIIYFLVSRRGTRVLGEGRAKVFIIKVENWLSKRSPWLLFFGTYLYIGFSPFPNDLLTISLGAGQAPKKIVIPAIILGDTTYAFLLAYLGSSLLMI